MYFTIAIKVPNENFLRFVSLQINTDLRREEIPVDLLNSIEATTRYIFYHAGDSLDQLFKYLTNELKLETSALNCVFLEGESILNRMIDEYVDVINAMIEARYPDIQLNVTLVK